MGRSFSFDNGSDTGPEPNTPRGRPKKPTASQKLPAWPPAEPKAPEEGELLQCAEEAVIRLINSDIDAKDMNAAIANAIRLLQVKHKLKPDDGPQDFWGQGDDN